MSLWIRSLSLPPSLFNLMNQLDLLYILMSQVLPHGLTHEISKESYEVVFHHILSSKNLMRQQGLNNEESSSCMPKMWEHFYESLYSIFLKNEVLMVAHSSLFMECNGL